MNTSTTTIQCKSRIKKLNLTYLTVIKRVISSTLSKYIYTTVCVCVAIIVCILQLERFSWLSED